jgi:CheY-like chemotaxis protein
MQETLFAILRNTVNVLIVDDVREMISVVREFLEPYKIYSVHTASSTRQALDILKTAPKRFHACLFDLGLSDVEDNEFYLMDKYGRDIPFVIMSAQDNTEKSFETKKHGAREYVRKGEADFIQRIIVCLNRQALQNMICPTLLEDPIDPLFKCMEALKNDNPERVVDWARQVNITDRQLRYEWKERLGFSPKHSLCVYHLYSRLFKEIELIADEGNEHTDQFWMEQCTQSLSESAAYKRFVDYYLVNRSGIAASVNGLPRRPAHSEEAGLGLSLN